MFLILRVNLIYSLWQGLHHPTVEKYLMLPVPVGTVLGGTGKSLSVFPLLCPAKAVPPLTCPLHHIHAKITDCPGPPDSSPDVPEPL